MKHLYRAGAKKKEEALFKKRYGKNWKKYYGGTINKVKQEQKKRGTDMNRESKRKRSAAAKKGWRRRRRDHSITRRRRRTVRRIGARMGGDLFSIDTNEVLTGFILYVVFMVAPALAVKYLGFGAGSSLEQSLVGAGAGYGTGILLKKDEVKNGSLGFAAGKYLWDSWLSGIFNPVQAIPTPTQDYLKLRVNDYVNENMPVPSSVYSSAYEN